MSEETVLLRGTNGVYSYTESESNILGKGGSAIVYKGIQVNESDDDDVILVAVKKLFVDSSGDNEFILRTKRAAQIRIDHPGLLKILDFIELDDNFYVISELLNGNTLDVLIADNVTNNRFYKKETVVEFTSSIIESLNALHHHDPPIIHRDIKPANIMVCDNGTLKLLDYGIAKIGGGSSGTSNVTREGSMMGTPAYLPLEQIRGLVNQISPATDFYSVGIMLYQLFTNELPFDGTYFDIIQAHEEDIIPNHEKIPPGFYEIIAKAADKNPLNRYHNGDKFIRDLRKALDSKGGIVKSSQSKFPLVKIAMSVLLIGGLAAGAYFLTPIIKNKIQAKNALVVEDPTLDSLDDKTSVADSLNALDTLSAEASKKDSLHNAFVDSILALVSESSKLTDSDGDGIIDSKDNCPDVAGKMSNNGCPESTDKAVANPTKPKTDVQEGSEKEVGEGEIVRNITDNSRFGLLLYEARRLKDAGDFKKSVKLYRTALIQKDDLEAKAELEALEKDCAENFARYLQLGQKELDAGVDKSQTIVYLTKAGTYALTSSEEMTVSSLLIDVYAMDFTDKKKTTTTETVVPSSQGDNSIEAILKDYNNCASTNTCHNFTAFAICKYNGIDDLKKRGDYINNQDIYDYVSSNRNWEILGSANDQNTLNNAQNMANEGRAVVAIDVNDFNKLAIMIVKGGQASSSTWGLKAPKCAAFFPGGGREALIGKTLNWAWSSPEGIQIWVRK